MSPWYRRHGKLMSPITDDEFIEHMKNGTFKHRKHKGFVALLYYTATRNGEALRTTKEQFTIRRDRLVWDVGPRLKKYRVLKDEHGHKIGTEPISFVTPPLPIMLELPYADEILWSVNQTQPEQRVWSYCRKTGYNIVQRVYAYPHFFRLNAITNFFDEGWTIAQVHSWTGLTLSALEHYIGVVDVTKMGESLVRRNRSGD